MSEKKPIWLNLGCGDDIREGYINVDCNYKHENVFNHDLEMDWPWLDSTVDYIIASDIIEHLHDKIFTMNEAYRVLKNDGRLHITVPTTDGPGAFQDPTHVSYWNRNSFKYFELDNPYRDRFAASYGIKAKFKIIHSNVTDTIDGPKLNIFLGAVK